MRLWKLYRYRKVLYNYQSGYRERNMTDHGENFMLGFQTYARKMF